MNTTTDYETTTLEDDPATSAVMLTRAERTLVMGLVSHYRHTMLLDLRLRPLTADGIRRYRLDLDEAAGLAAKLGGRA